MSDIKEVFKESIRKVIASINPGVADISGIGDGTLKGAIRELNGKMPDVLIKSGYVQFPDVAAGKIIEQTVTFKTAFSSNPRVIASVFSDTSNPEYGKVSIMVRDITKTSFVLRCANSGTYTVAPACEWIATSIGNQ